MSRVICNVSYTGPGSGGQSASRLANYLQYRQQDEDGDRYERQELYGDRQEFQEAAKERAEQGSRSSYTHTVISPERGSEYTDRDFEALISEWTRDSSGEEQPHIATIHRDSDHAHAHVAVVRDKFDKAELRELKESTYERAGDREKIMDLRAEMEPDNEAEMEPQRGYGLHMEAAEGEREQGQEYEPGPDQDGRERQQEPARNEAPQQDQQQDQDLEP